MTDKPHVDEKTLRTMQELLRQPPKPHSEMKLGKPHGKGRAPLKKKRTSGAR